MMVGKTEIVINTQTMLEALSEYLGRKLSLGETRALKVLSVAEQKAGYGNQVVEFKVTIDVVEAAAPADPALP